jgi:signal peptidase II
LTIGGALGNPFDRVVHGHVIDFIQLHAGGDHWPAFNVADSAICIGAVLLVWDAIRQPKVNAATATSTESKAEN